jgi:hypothetical protein
LKVGILETAAAEEEEEEEEIMQECRLQWRK